MSSLTDLLGNEVLSQITKGMKGNSKNIDSAMKTALPILMKSLTKNASTRSGRTSLAESLKKHDEKIFASVESLTKNPEKGEGAGILKHILGGNLKNAVSAISKESGLDTNDSGNILKIAAPLLMGALGKDVKNINSKDLMNLLQKGTSELSKGGSLMDISTKFLDENGDGNIKDDLLKKGIAFLKNKFFK